MLYHLPGGSDDGWSLPWGSYPRSPIVLHGAVLLFVKLLDGQRGSRKLLIGQSGTALRWHAVVLGVTLATRDGLWVRFVSR